MDFAIYGLAVVGFLAIGIIATAVALICITALQRDD